MPARGSSASKPIPSSGNDALEEVREKLGQDVPEAMLRHLMGLYLTGSPTRRTKDSASTAKGKQVKPIDRR
jgi:hypothetical protein